MDMIEKIARALCRDNTGKELSWGMWTGSAIAALKAMREPTSEMVEAGLQTGSRFGKTAMENIFQTMVDAALAEGREG